MSCKGEAEKEAGQLENATRIALGQADAAAHCIHPDCEAHINQATGLCTRGHAQQIPAQVERDPQTYTQARDWGQAFATFLSTYEYAWGLRKEGVPCGWSTGGCQVLADALQLWLGEENVIRSMFAQVGGNLPEGPRADHVVTRCGVWCLDGLGIQTEEALVDLFLQDKAEEWDELEGGDDVGDDWEDGEHNPENYDLVPYDPAILGTIQRQPEISQRLAGLLAQRWDRDEVLRLLGTRSSSRQLPLAVRDIPPGPGFARVNNADANGLPNIHTGGVWRSPDGREYWKPLDGRPYSNADFHLPTQEAEALELMADVPGFPRNWRVEEIPVVVDGQTYTRRWLVREQVWPVPAEYPADRLRLDDVRAIEDGLRRLNQRGWGIGDHLSVAIDRQRRPLILDLSAAGPEENPAADDTDRFLRWAESMGYGRLVQLRRAGRDLTDMASAYGDPQWPRGEDGRPDLGYVHVYASRNRPAAATWVDVPGAHFRAGDVAQEGVHTWVVTKEPLSAEQIQRFDLTWAWSPVRYSGGSE